MLRLLRKAIYRMGYRPRWPSIFYSPSLAMMYAASEAVKAAYPNKLMILPNSVSYQEIIVPDNTPSIDPQKLRENFQVVNDAMLEVEQNRQDIAFYQRLRAQQAEAGYVDPNLEEHIAILTAMSMESGDPDPGAGIYPAPKVEEPIFYCPLCGKPLDHLAPTAYFECATMKHGAFEIFVGGGRLTLKQVKTK